MICYSECCQTAFYCVLTMNHTAITHQLKYTRIIFKGHDRQQTLYSMSFSM
jgi:phage terminase large subunit